MKLQIHRRRLPRMCLLNIVRVVINKIGRSPCLCRISALDVFCEMDGRESRYIKEVLDWYRDEDAGDLRRSELNELLERMTYLKSLSEIRNQNIVMNEELVKNIVMNAEFVRTS